MRKPGSAEGLTRAEAERRLRELIGEVQATSSPDRSLVEAAELHLEALTAKGRSR